MERKGFTLIEVIMVLALAGLILTLVFLAVAQGNQYRRDNDRQAAAAKYLAATRQWISDNNGVIPDSTGTIIGTDGSVAYDSANGVMLKYIMVNGQTFTTPEGAPWKPLWQSGLPSSVTGSGNLDKLYISADADCSGGGIIADASSRKIAVAVEEEGGQSYCIAG